MNSYRRHQKTLPRRRLSNTIETKGGVSRIEAFLTIPGISVSTAERLSVTRWISLFDLLEGQDSFGAIRLALSELQKTGYISPYYGTDYMYTDRGQTVFFNEFYDQDHGHNAGLFFPYYTPTQTQLNRDAADICCNERVRLHTLAYEWTLKNLQNLNELMSPRIVATNMAEAFYQSTQIATINGDFNAPEHVGYNAQVLHDTLMQGVFPDGNRFARRRSLQVTSIFNELTGIALDPLPR